MQEYWKRPQFVDKGLPGILSPFDLWIFGYLDIWISSFSICVPYSFLAWQDSCEERDRCTAVNWKDEGKAECILRACSLPVLPPMKPYPEWKAYYLASPTTTTTQTTSISTTTTTTTSSTTVIPGTAHGCLFVDRRDIIGDILFLHSHFGPSGELVIPGGRIKLGTADDCAKLCSLEEECDAFAFHTGWKECRMVRDGGLDRGRSYSGTGGICPKREGKKTAGQEDDAYEFVHPDEADFVCETLCKLLQGCVSWKFQIATNRNNCKLSF